MSDMDAALQRECDIGAALQRAYDLEINCRCKLESFWDGGWELSIGGSHIDGWKECFPHLTLQECALGINRYLDSLLSEEKAE